MFDHAVHTFRLLLDGADPLEDDALLDLLHEQGFDDALFARVGGVPTVDLDRDAPSFTAAVLDAIEALERVDPRLKVVRAEPDDLVSATVIAERAGRTRQNIQQLIAGERGPGGFPAPVAFVDAKTRVYRWSEVAPWLRDAIGADLELPYAQADAEFLAALNGALECRRHLRRFVGEGGERETVRRVLGFGTGKTSLAVSALSSTMAAAADALAMETSAVVYLGRALAWHYPKQAPDSQDVRSALETAVGSYVDGLALQRAGRDASARALHRRSLVSIFKLHGGLDSCRDLTYRFVDPDDEVTEHLMRKLRSCDPASDRQLIFPFISRGPSNLQLVCRAYDELSRDQSPRVEHDEDTSATLWAVPDPPDRHERPGAALAPTFLMAVTLRDLAERWHAPERELADDLVRRLTDALSAEP